MANIKQEYIGTNVAQNTSNYRWWTLSDAELHSSVFSVVASIEKQSNYQHNLNIQHARLYSDLELLGFAQYALAQNTRPDTLLQNRITYNVIKSVADTACSKIAKNRPKPMFLTNNGDWLQRERGKKLTDYVAGVFYDCNIYELAERMFMDACVFGTGALKVFTKDGRIRVEKVFIDELRVDQIEGANASPKQIHQVKYMSRDVLLELFPEHRVAIMAASSGLPYGVESIDDVVKVVESWRLPYSDDKPGKHTWCIETACLFSEPYVKSYFPFVFFRWNDRISGFFGSGVAEELKGIQLSINKTLRSIQIAQDRVAVPRAFIEQGSNVVTSHLNNDIGAIVKYTGNKPTFDTPTAMNPEVYNHLKWLISSAYELSGVSQLSASSRKPAGLDSGVALREYSDIESERFMLTAMRYEKTFLDLAKIIVNISKDLYEQDKNISVTVPGSTFIKSIKWKDVDIDEDEFIMKTWPVSLLPSSPAGKLQKVQELVQAGFIDKDAALQLLEYPDLDSFVSLQTANNDLIEKQLAKMINEDVYLPPEPYMNLDKAIEYGHKYYVQGRLDEVPEDRLQHVLRFIDDADMMKQQQAPAPLPQEAAPVAPIAVPEAPAQTDLLPNVPLAP